jgi:hypothetical protein
MNNLSDGQTKWQPVNNQARLAVRPANDEDALHIKLKDGSEIAFAQCSKAAASVLADSRLLLKTGDRIGKLTFIGVTKKMLGLCRCDCGRVESFSLVYLFRQRGSQAGHGCNECNTLKHSIKRAAEKS